MKNLVVVLALLIFVANVSAVELNQPPAPKEPNKPALPKEPAVHKPITITGTVNVMKDKEGAIIAVRLITSRNIGYNITLDAKGKELAERFAGKTAEVTGIPETKEEVKWLTVGKFTEAPKPAPRTPRRPRR